MSALAASPPQPWPFSPGQKIGFVSFGNSVQKQKIFALTSQSTELERKQSEISGQDFLTQIQVLPVSYFKTLIPESVSPGELELQYSSYLNDTAEQTLAELSLGRILDHEGLHRGITTEVPLSRTNYIIRAILAAYQPDDAAMKVGPVADLDPVFQELKKAVGTQPVRFNIDWKNCSGNLQFSCMQFKKQPNWREVHLEFKIFPGTLGEFSQAIAEKLQSTARSVARLQVWQLLVSERKARLSRLQPVISDEELRKEFALLKQTDTFESAWKERKTQELLIQKVKDSRQEVLNRQILGELFSENPFVEQVALCPTAESVCIRFDASRWTNRVVLSNSISK